MKFLRQSGFAAMLAVLPTVLAHSWVLSSQKPSLTTQIDSISNGENTGFIRGYVGHIDLSETFKTLGDVIYPLHNMLMIDRWSTPLHEHPTRSNRLYQSVPSTSC